MEGLGEGLILLGNTISNNAKVKLQEKLAREREDREEERLAARDARREAAELRKPDKNMTDYDYDSGVKILRNSNGDELRRVPMTKSEMEEYGTKKQRDKVSLDNLLLQGEASKLSIEGKRKELANYEEDRAFDRAYKERSLDVRLATGGRRGSSSNDEAMPTPEEVGRAIRTANKDVVSQYTKDTDAPLTAEEVTEASRYAAIRAAERGKEGQVEEIFRDTLRRMQLNKKQKKPASSAASGKIKIGV